MINDLLYFVTNLLLSHNIFYLYICINLNLSIIFLFFSGAKYLSLGISTGFSSSWSSLGIVLEVYKIYHHCTMLISFQFYYQLNYQFSLLFSDLLRGWVRNSLAWYRSFWAYLRLRFLVIFGLILLPLYLAKDIVFNKFSISRFTRIPHAWIYNSS